MRDLWAQNKPPSSKNSDKYNYSDPNIIKVNLSKHHKPGCCIAFSISISTNACLL